MSDVLVLYAALCCAVQDNMCGVKLHSVDWSGTRSNLSRGHVLGWAAGSDRQAFSMHCSRAGNSSSSDRNSSNTTGSCGCGEGFAAAHLLTGVAEASTAEWQLPSQMLVLNTSCLASKVQHGHGSNISILQECLLAASGSSSGSSGAAFTLPRAFSGDAVNITVSLAHGSAAFENAASAVAAAPCANASPPGSGSTSNNLAVVQLQQDPDGELFVIGPSTAAVNGSGIAQFCNMALQPIDPPLQNRQFSFSLRPDTGSGLLAQVEPVIVTVQLLRCTLGQHMTVRCNGLTWMHLPVDISYRLLALSRSAHP